MTKNLDLLKEEIKHKSVHIFDMDGTLVDLEELNFTTFHEIIKLKLDREFTQDDYQKYFSGAGSRNGFTSYIAAYSLDYSADQLVEEYRKIKDEILNSRIHEVVKVKDGALELLDLLKSRGCKLVVATSSFYDFAKKITEFFGLYERFDIFLSERDIKNNKPDPEIFIKAQEMSGAAKEQCIIYEDSQNGIRSALASGILCVGLYNPGLNDSYIDEADVVIEGFGEVSGVLE